jgi:uncharacterized membrane protein
MVFYRSLIPILVLGLIFLPADPAAAERTTPDDPRGFIESIAEGIYQLAWPTATYESVSIQSIEPGRGGVDVLVRLSGKSGFSGGDLWLVLVLEVRRGVLHDIRVAQHNALLAHPFATVQGFGELIAELNRQQGYRFHVANDCRHPIRIAIHYKKVGGEWFTEGWWEVAAKSSRYLSYSDGTFPRTDDSVVYYFAETQDRTLYWGGAHKVLFDGRPLSMAQYEDTEGDTDWGLSCPGL